MQDHSYLQNFNMLMLSIFFLSSLVFAQEELQCHLPGECSGGQYVGITEEVDYNDCLRTCKNSNVACEWFTYSENVRSCVQYSDCPEIDDACIGCYTGQKECDLENAVCEVQGFCDGRIVALDTTVSSKDCLDLCQIYDECNWYSYFPETSYCVLTANCEFLDVSCSDCTTGEKQCYEGASPMNKLLVIGGQGALSQVELIDLAAPNRTCPPFPNYPIASQGSVGAYIDGRATVCGGILTTSSYDTTNRCYYFDTITNDWVRTWSMTELRTSHAGILLSPSEWWITGGSSSSGSSSVGRLTEMYTSGSAFLPDVDLPESMAYHTMVQANSTHVVVVGLGDDSKKAWIFDRNTNLWTPLPDMRVERYMSHAGLVTYPDGHKSIVVVGTNAFYSFNGSSEILDLDQLTWRYGKPLPGVSGYEDWYGGSSVPYGDSFMVVGGVLDKSPLVLQNSIYTFDTDTEEWVLLPQRLMNARYNAAAFLVPSNFAHCTS